MTDVLADKFCTPCRGGIPPLQPLLGPRPVGQQGLIRGGAGNDARVVVEGLLPLPQANVGVTPVAVESPEGRGRRGRSFCEDLDGGSVVGCLPGEIGILSGKLGSSEALESPDSP